MFGLLSTTITSNVSTYITQSQFKHNHTAKSILQDYVDSDLL